MSELHSPPWNNVPLNWLVMFAFIFALRVHTQAAPTFGMLLHSLTALMPYRITW